MAAKLTPDELKSEIAKKQQHIQMRLDSLQDEVLTLGDSAKRAVLDNPLVGVGGALAAGLLVGLIFGKRKPFNAENRHRELVEHYLDAVADATQKAVVKGKQPGEAVRDALQDRTPLIVYETPENKSGILYKTLDLLLTTAVGFAVKTGFDHLLKGDFVPNLVDDVHDPDA